MNQYRVAIVGATGAVGSIFLESLESRNFPVGELFLYASPRSEGKVIHFRNKPYRIFGLTPENIEKVDFAFFSAGGTLSKEYAPLFAEKGATVIDNSSAWRMDPKIPLVVPEVNPEALEGVQGIIANPNCSTIQMVVALKPLHDAAKVKRVVVSTYQAISGAGGLALDEFDGQIRDSVLKDGFSRNEIFSRPMAYNAVAQIPHSKDAFLESGYTGEEFKMIAETKKIFSDSSIQVAPTCVRIPVRNGHCESINVETEKEISVKEALALFRSAPGVVLCESPEDLPTPAEIDGRPEVFIGRVRKDPTVAHGLHLWVVADNIRKGAALNAVQIAEKLIS